jgi:hypothetical protein
MALATIDSNDAHTHAFEWLDRRRGMTIGITVFSADRACPSIAFEATIDDVGTAADGRMVEVTFEENESFGPTLDAEGVLVDRTDDEVLHLRHGSVRTHVWVAAAPIMAAGCSRVE